MESNSVDTSRRERQGKRSRSRNSSSSNSVVDDESVQNRPMAKYVLILFGCFAAGAFVSKVGSNFSVSGPPPKPTSILLPTSSSSPFDATQPDTRYLGGTPGVRQLLPPTRFPLAATQPDTPYPRDTAKSGPRCPSYASGGSEASDDDSYGAILREHGAGKVACTAPEHAGLSLPFRSPLVAPAFCSSQPPALHGSAADACYTWAKQDYYPLTLPNALAIAGPGGKWHGDRTRLRSAVGRAMQGKPMRVVVYGCSFTDGHGCPSRWFNGTEMKREAGVWPSRLQSLLRWMFPRNPRLVQVELFAYDGGSSFEILRNLHLTAKKPADVYIVDFSPNDFNANTKGGAGTAATTATVVKTLLQLPNSPALVYVETFGYKSAPFCSFEQIDRCDADFEHGFQPRGACLGREGCDFGSFTERGCAEPCKGKPTWAPPPDLLRRCPGGGAALDNCRAGVPLPVPAMVGDSQEGAGRRAYVEWWAKHMVHGRVTKNPSARNWGCEPTGAAGNLHMVSLEHYNVPVVSLQDATCDFDKCGPLSPQRYPLWGKGDAHTDCLPTHQVLADLVAASFAAEALGACGVPLQQPEKPTAAAAAAAAAEVSTASTVGGTAAAAILPGSGNDASGGSSGGLVVKGPSSSSSSSSSSSTAAVLMEDAIQSPRAGGGGTEKSTGLEVCAKPLVDLDAPVEAKKERPSAAVILGDQWHLEDDSGKGKYGWLYLRDRAAGELDDREKKRWGHATTGLVLELEIGEPGTVVLEFLRSYEGFGNATASFHLARPAARHENDARDGKKLKLKRPEPRLLEGQWSTRFSMKDHESFTGFWPPGRWDLRIEPAESCKKFKVLGVESC